MMLIRSIALLLLLAFPVDAVVAQVAAIRAGQLVDPEEGVSATDQIILIEDGLIKAVGGDVAIPEDAEVIDLAGMTVVPGLIDAHVHLCLNVRPDRDAFNYYITNVMDPNAARAVDGVINARQVLEAGFTTVRDIGNDGNYACAAVRDAIDAGRIPGPTMIYAGRIIAPYGGQFQLQPDRVALGEPEYFYADTRDEMKKAIRENIHFGSTVIKIVIDDQDYTYTADDIRYIVDEAGRAGRKVAAHAWTPDGAHNAALAGVASIEHLWTIRDEDIELAKENGVVAVFTPFPPVEAEVVGGGGDHELQISRIRAALQSGIPMAFGSDAVTQIEGFDRGSLAMARIDMLLEAGMSPAQLLKSMTVTAAQLLGVDDKRGALRPGMAADIVAMQANPLDDPQALKKVSFVMKAGKVVR